MWMTPLPSWSHPIEEPSWTTSTLLTSISSLPVKNKEKMGSLPFLDVLVLPKEDGSLSSTVFRKATHTDLCLQWDSHHTLPSKYSVVGTLLHRANTICSEPHLLRQEEDHLYKALSTCKYPAWTLNRIKMRIRNPNTRKNSSNKTSLELTSTRNHTSLFLIKEGSVKVSRELVTTMGYRYTSKEVQQVKTLLVAPKDQDPIKNRSGVIYRFKCNSVECDDENIGESSRTFGERFREHLQAPSPVFDHFNTTGHQVSLENFSIVGREEQNLMRAIKEALYIRVNNPSNDQDPIIGI